MAIPGYRIIRKIRQGGMSTVYLATQQSVDREVALKVMSPSLSSDPSFGSRFYREAKIVGQLSHPNIVAIYDVGSHKHYNYIAMDYLPGIPLQDKLDQGVSTQEATRIVREMASALDYAHHRGYVHRDLKPDNILFRQDGSAVLCDFGIAKALKGNIKMTNVGTVLGTPHYMSPEQAQGKEIDGRADIYSLGVVFYEMLAGQVPFAGDDAVAIAVKHMTSPIPKLPQQQKAFQPIIEQMMAKKPTARFQTGQEIITALDQLESTLSSRDESHLTLTSSTTVEAFGLINALVSNLGTAITQSFKRLMLTNIKFSSGPKPLSHKQMEDLDTFILDNEHDDDELSSKMADMPLIQDTIEQPAIRMSRLWLYGPAVFIVIGITAFLYLDKEHPDQLKEAYLEVSTTETNTADIKLDVATTPPPIEQQTLVSANELIPEIAPAPIIETKAKIKVKPKFSLTINTTPAEAEIRILNIKPRFTQGMKLSSGPYHISVEAQDYFPQKIWLKIRNRDVDRAIILEPTRRAFPAGSIIQDQLKTGDNSPEFIVIPKGQLIPLHGQYKIELTQAVAVSVSEISFKQYEQFAQSTQRRLPNDYEWGRSDRPVVDVSYDDAVAYSQWLSEQTGNSYRLLTEQEWEYVASAGKTTGYWWGQSTAAQKANCRKGCKSEFSKFFGSSTAPVRHYEANAFGLYDTAGNVAEWLADCTQMDDSQARCLKAIAAGGSHQDNNKNIRSDSTADIETTGNKYTGFRLLLEL